MGLIGNVLQPIYTGFHSVLMSPLDFLARPVRWLRALSDFKATIGGGPNFAYELCLRKVTDEEIATLDLSNWTVAFNGAEPIFSDTLDRFAARFGPCGFQRRAFYPCYGLAEATLILTGAAKNTEPMMLDVDTEALGRGRAEPNTGQDTTRLVGSGRMLFAQDFRIVDPGHRARVRGRAGRRDLGIRSRDRAGLLSARGSHRAGLRPSPAPRNRVRLPPDRRPRLPPRGRAVRDRADQGRDDHAGTQLLPAGCRAHDRRQSPGTATGGDRMLHHSPRRGAATGGGARARPRRDGRRCTPRCSLPCARRSYASTVCACTTRC